MTENYSSDVSLNFIEQIISDDLDAGRTAEVVTRFPPEPNGYLHIGHAKSICLNFGLAERFNGRCNLRFDDTNPEKEDDEYVQSIIEDVKWLGFDWDSDVKYASDYFEQLYQWAQYLVKEGLAYVCELNAEHTREYRGTFTEPGKNSPYRERPAEESLQLLEQMKEGEVAEGAMTLRAKIDMASPNLNMRDPVLYRIKKAAHHRTGDAWNIYPSYDFAHGQEDAIEGVTHSVCTLEFEAHRPLYEWFIEHLPVPAKPRQFEFGRLNLNYTVTSKRKLKQLVDDKLVNGWDDPRMPTIAGIRRRGVSPAAVRNFCNSLAVAKTDGVVDVAQFDHFIRDDLNKNAPRAMVVLNPLKVVISNMEQDHLEWLSAPVHPDWEQGGDMGERKLPFTREIYIDQADFKQEYSKKFKKKFCPGKRIRLRNGYVLQAGDFLCDDQGNVIQVNATLVPDTLGKDPADGDKPKGVVHWVSATHGAQITVHQYDRLFNHADPESGEGYLSHLNENSLVVKESCWAEPGLLEARAGDRFQFEREGYFCRDIACEESQTVPPVFNMTIGLRDTWSQN